MIATMRRSLPITLAGLGVLALVSACAESPGAEAGAPSSSAATSSSAAASSSAEEPASSGDELAAALLPAEAFGPDAQVVTVDVRQLATSGSGGLPAGGSVTPPECGQDVGATQLTPEDFGTVVAQSATTPTGITVEVLAEGEEVAGEESGFDDLLTRCPQVTVHAPDGSTATVDFTALEVPDLGDSSGGVAFTTAVRAADGTELTVPSLLAVATDGQRMVYLQQTGTSSVPLDQAVFTTLFEDAFEAQRNG
jgi:hypothetical protein